MLGHLHVPLGGHHLHRPRGRNHGDPPGGLLRAAHAQGIPLHLLQGEPFLLLFSPLVPDAHYNSEPQDKPFFSLQIQQLEFDLK